MPHSLFNPTQYSPVAWTVHRLQRKRFFLEIELEQIILKYVTYMYMYMYIMYYTIITGS